VKLCDLAVVVTVAVAVCQEPDQVPVTPSFGSTTRLIQVNVVAHDRKGQPVTNLSKEDFQLFENGRLQAISHFAFERATAARQATLAPNEFSNQFTATNSSRSGYSLILIDWMNSSLGARIVSQQQVLKLLKQIELTDLVSVCMLDRGLRVLHDFTSDREALVKKISEAYGRLNVTPVGNATALADSEVFFMSADEQAVTHMSRFFGTQRILETFKSFDQIANYLGSVPGRKSLIWVTSGFPSALGYDPPSKNLPPDVDAWAQPMQTERRTFDGEMERAVRRFNDADIAVYPVDARGLLAGSRGLVNVAVMTEVAGRTGGRAFYNRNDIDTAMRTALDDSLTSYALGYYPSHSSNDGNFRKIRVSVRQPGIEIRYRSGYQAEGNSKRKTSPEADLQQLLGSPLDATVLPVSAHAERVGEKLDVRIRLEPSTLMLREQKDRRVGKVSIFFNFRPDDAKGTREVMSVSTNLNLTQPQYQALLKREMIFRKQLAMPSAATSLRLVVRDEESALMGSVTIPLSAVH
jgi:VWFA-related protein